MDQKYGEFVGVDNLYYALLTADTDSAYTPGAVSYLAPVADIGGAPEINNLTTYYDNKAANNYVSEGKTELKIQVSNVPAQLMAILLGKKYDETDGRVYDSGAPNPPDVALGFRYNMGKEGFRYFWYLKGTFSGGAEEATTKKENVEIKTYTLTFTAVATTYKWTVDTESISLKRVYADTADEAFDPTGWFGQVQTPDAVGAPDAFALSSSNPIDDAVDVAVTISPALTFNNAIESYAVTMINAETMVVIAAAISLDTTRKILTVNPDSNLAASTTQYAIIVSSITDIYGQTLENTIITFTTIA